MTAVAETVERSGPGTRLLFASVLALTTVCAAAQSPAARPQLISGEVYAHGAQALLTPPSNSSPIVLRSFVAEGERVRSGDVVLRIDGGAAATSIRNFKSQQVQTQARADKEIAELKVKAVDAERAWRNAETTVAKAKADAGIPREHLSALDFDRYQGELTRAERDLTVKRGDWDTASAAVRRRGEDAQLEIGQLQRQIDYWQTQVAASELRAERDGIVVHGFDPWRGTRYDEGSSSYPGQRVGEIVDGTDQQRLGVRAFALEVDRSALALDQSVAVSFDALGARSMAGRVARIVGAPAEKAEWGAGRYFEVEIEVELSAADTAALRPGSSARVRISGEQNQVAATAIVPQRRFEGEIIALDASAISPPVVGDLWMLTLTQLVADGTPVKAGDVVAAFDGNEVMRVLNEKSSQLNEKTRQLERLQLELAERERAERIATAEQRAKLTKAQRKAAQPENLIAALEYTKLVADRRLAEIEMELLERRERLAEQQRKAERAQIEAEIAALQGEVDEFQAGLMALNVKAERSGVMLHLSSWQGEKFDVGAQVFRGQSVAQIPDLSRLAARMQVPERQIAAVQLGQRAKIDVEGGAVPTLSGKVTQISRVVRSRSKAKPVPVIDVDIEFDTPTEAARLKPGQPVRVELQAGEGA
jgi:multidrug resistance efflux pump